MLTRRSFLRDLLSTVAAAALVKNGILRPEQVIAEPKRRVFDMAANTWRRYTTLGTFWRGHVGHCAVWNTWLTEKETDAISDIVAPPLWRLFWRRGIKGRDVPRGQPPYGDIFDGCDDYVNVYDGGA